MAFTSTATAFHFAAAPCRKRRGPHLRLHAHPPVHAADPVRHGPPRAQEGGIERRGTERNARAHAPHARAQEEARRSRPVRDTRVRRERASGVLICCRPAWHECSTYREQRSGAGYHMRPSHATRLSHVTSHRERSSIYRGRRSDASERQAVSPSHVGISTSRGDRQSMCSVFSAR